MVVTESFLTDDKFFQVIRSDSGKNRIFINTPKFTLIPREFYSADLREHYVRFSNGLKTDEVIIENQIQGGNYYLLFPINNNLKYSFEINFPNSFFYHFATALVSRLLDAEQSDMSFTLINKQDQHFYLIIRKNERIVLLNSYIINQDDDLIYFTINGLRKNDIDPKDARVYYSGNITPRDSMVFILKKYVRTLTELPQSSNNDDINCLYKSFRFNQAIK